MESFRRALAINPVYASAQANLANVLADLGRIEDSIEHSRRALAIDPGNAGTHSDLIFNLNFDARADIAEQQAERRRWAEVHADRLAPKNPPLPRDPDPARRLRVGYVSAHFRAYAATYAFGGVLINHDPEQFEVFCYSDTRDKDDLTARFSARADHWRDTSGLSDDAMADLIRRDRIDILVDLVGHMAGHRLLVFARKPAPIQITAWGEPTGTGLAAMDYLLADPVLVPAAERPLLRERVIDLPGALGFWTPEPLPEPGPLPAHAREFVTFGSFNRRAKLTAATLACWGGILRALPGARLTLKNKAYGETNEQDMFNAALDAAGIDPARVDVLGQTGRSQQFEAYRAIDIALDPFPHGGGMTTLDALAMGVPVVTWSGGTISSRLAASCLTALDLTRFIARDAKSTWRSRSPRRRTSTPWQVSGANCRAFWPPRRSAIRSATPAPSRPPTARPGAAAAWKPAGLRPDVAPGYAAPALAFSHHSCHMRLSAASNSRAKRGASHSGEARTRARSSARSSASAARSAASAAAMRT